MKITLQLQVLRLPMICPKQYQPFWEWFVPEPDTPFVGVFLSSKPSHYQWHFGSSGEFCKYSRSSRSRPDRSGDYLKFPHFGFGITLLFDVGDDIDTVTATCRCITFCWNEFRKYANIVPCAIGVRGPGLAFLSLMCWTARRAWDKAKLQNRHKQMPRTRKWSVVWRDQHSQKKIFQKDVLNRSSDNVMGCDNIFCHY